VSIFATPPPRAEEEWGFPEENTEVKKGSAACSRSPSKQQTTVLIWIWAQVIPCLLSLVLYHIRLAGSLSTLLVLGVWLPVGPAHYHSETASCAACMPATRLPAPAARHTRVMRFATRVTKPALDFAGTGRLSPAPGEECGQHRGRGPRQERHHRPGPMSKPFLDEPGLAGHLASHFPLLPVPARAEFHLLQQSGP